MAATTPKMLLDGAWRVLYSMEGPEGTKGALDYMGIALSRLSCQDRRRLQEYLFGLVCDRSNGSAPMLKYDGLHIGLVITDLAAKLSDERGGVPEEFYRALGVLPPFDGRTRTVLGKTLLLKPDKKDDRFVQLSDIASQPDAEAAFRTMRWRHGVLVTYAGIEKDYAEKQLECFRENAASAPAQSKAELFDAWSGELEA